MFGPIKIRSGPLTAHEAATIAHALEVARRPLSVAPPLVLIEDVNGRRLSIDDGGVADKNHILARITNSGTSGGSPTKYEFQQQKLSFTVLPSLSDDTNGIVGRISTNTWALEINNATVANDTIVLLHRDPVTGRYWFDENELGGATTDVDIVTNVCLVASGDTHTLTVQKQTLRVPSSWVIGDPTCTTNPLDCCPVTTSCGDCDNVPRTLCATFSGALATIGTVTLTYVDSGSAEGTWRGTYAACYDPDPASTFVYFYCNPSTGLYHLYLTDGGFQNITGIAPTCDPFSWTYSGTSTAGSCSGSASVTIAEGECDGPGSGSGVDDCCPGAPSILSLTETGGASCCGLDYLSGEAMTYSATGLFGIGAGWYTTEIPCNGGTVQFALYCTGTLWFLAMYCDGAYVADTIASSYTCEPVSITFDTITETSDCCTGTSSFTVTE